MRLDLDELERQARASMDGDYAIGDHWTPGDKQTLALIAIVRKAREFFAARGHGPWGDLGDEVVAEMERHGVL